MSSGFGDLTRQANQLVAAGDLAGAQELLGAALANADPSPANASAELADAAGLQARVLVALGEPHSARGWAAFAYAAASRLHGPADQRTVAAAATLAAVLHRVGSHDRSALLYRDVIIELTATDGPESLRVLAAHADLATVEYARGECEVARTRLQEAWELHREVYGDGHLSGIKMLARLGAMQRDCGHFTEGHGHLALARELCREHLPADHPLATQVAALARAAANPDHVCADEDAVAGPEPLAGPTTEQATPGHPSDLGHPRQYGGHGGERPVGSAAESTGRHAAGADRTGDHPTSRAGEYHPTNQAGDQHPAGRVADHPTGQAAAGRYVPGPPGDHPPGHTGVTTHPAPGLATRSAYPPAHDDPPHPSYRIPPQPDAAGWDRSPAGTGAGDHPAGQNGGGWAGRATGQDWPPYEDQPSSGGPDPAARADEPRAVPPLPPTVPALASLARATRALPPPTHRDPPDGGDGVRRVQHLPARRHAALPVRIHRPPTAQRRNTPVILAGLVVVLLGAGAVIAGFALVDGEEPEPGGRSAGPPPGAESAGPTPVPTTAAAPGSPPTEVTLVDGRDRVTLDWVYPAGAEGPVVVSGGRAGQEPSAIQELPAGATSFVVYGLDQNTDFCFSVAVVYSTDTVGRARPVCTSRSGASPDR
ncbi:tetratricopeptide repeat protein [Solwaraspora sp. WMMD1047]|uniref:tetratricopeptide repeat protein n=1 Tax=Solwaraspora sp. WMMD1047 TaxID=3016102 RepID=UPI00241787C5|nr:tetratricopeptide repeat protein [Solwaraspora sp. WMMD1047]MDG4831619.1 tetratricopeptide repeat protein [Solwaraspora sp. WMMD1047]